MSAAQLIPLGAGVLTALLHLSATIGSPGTFMLAYFAQLPIAATGLGIGFMPAAIASAVAAVIVAIGAPGGGSLTLFLAITVLPVMLVVYFALQNRTTEDGVTAWYPPGRILGWLTALGLLAIAIALAVFAGSEGGLRGAIEGYLTAFFQTFPRASDAAIETFVQSMSQIFPGAAATSWIFMTAINGILAQRLLAAAGRNLRPKPAWRALDTVGWPVYVAVAGAVGVILGGFPAFVGLNVLIVALVPFFFIGMAVLHSISATWPGRPLILAGVYLLLVILLWPAAIVALLGIAENWMKLRDRAKPSGTNKGND